MSTPMSIPMSTATESPFSSTSSLASSTSTMCDPSDASLPPTSNNLNREERLRLLRSTRKLGALLGTTPMLIDTELSESDYVAPLASPRTKTRRREGRIFPGRAASPTSSISSVEDYVIVPQSVQSSNYQFIFSPDDQEATPSSSAAAAARRASVSDIARASNVSIGTTASRKRKARGPIPVALVFDMPRSGSGSGAGTQPRSAAASRFGTNSSHGASISKKATAGMTPSNRAQPQPSLFLRLRPAFGRSNIKQQPVPANSPYIHLPQPNLPSPTSQTRLPLSPSMATFANSNLSTASLASSHYSSKGGYLNVGKSSQSYDEFDYMDTTPEGQRALTERDRRRKMAKLARTLGENVPPELVFRPPPPTRRTSGAYTSASFGLQSYPKPPPPPPVVPGLPKLAVADVPAPDSASTAVAPTPSTSSSKSSRKSRPRSLTLAPSSSTDATRGTTSMDVPASPAMVQGSHRVTKSLGRAKSIKGATSAATSASPEHPFEEYSDASRSASRAGANGGSGFGRRKEREWSGEWNLKDMNDVAARLRGLKA